MDPSALPPRSYVPARARWWCVETSVQFQMLIDAWCCRDWKRVDHYAEALRVLGVDVSISSKSGEPPLTREAWKTAERMMRAY